jgi:type I restriction enzyme S subunit
VREEPCRWRSVALGTVLEHLIDHRGKTPAKLGGNWTTQGVPAISAIHIKNGKIDWSRRERYVTEEM